MKLEDWNLRYPPGTRVRFYPLRHIDAHVETETTSRAMPMANGEPGAVVAFNRRAVPLEALEVVR